MTLDEFYFTGIFSWMSIGICRAFCHFELFLLLQKIFFKIISYAINLCNFGFWEHSDNSFDIIIYHYKFIDFIAMFLSLYKIFLHLFHVGIWQRTNQILY